MKKKRSEVAEGSTQVGGSWGARKQIQTAVCVWRCAARPSERQLPAAAAGLFVLFYFLEPARPARLVWNRGSGARATPQISGRLLLAEPDPPSQVTVRKPA